MGGWLTRIEGVCMSSKEQAEKRRDTGETHTGAG
jgi:hypothetical protein